MPKMHNNIHAAELNAIENAENDIEIVQRWTAEGTK